MHWRNLTPIQQRALAGIKKRGRASASDLRCSVATLRALERRKLIRVDTTFASIAFPRNAEAQLREGGERLLREFRKS